MPSDPAQLKRDIAAYARSLGFERMGVTSAEPLEAAAESLGAWVEDGCAGEMAYMEKDWPSRARPADRLSGAKSVIALAVSYYNGDIPSSKCEGMGRVARYAWGQDYHKVVEKRMDALVRYIESLVPETRCKTYVDTGPVLERALAQKSGLGFIGKNTLLITRGMGSWVFLASIITTLELPLDGPDTRSCGSCTLCIDACPTQALSEPYRVDARKCIAYLTIESKSPVPEELRSKMGDWVFGCDVCQDVCPHNTRVPLTPIANFKPEAGAGPFLNLQDVLALKNDQDFDARFAGTPLKRAKRQGLQRNACLSAANQKRVDLLPQLEALASNDPHPVVREHAS